MSLTEEELQAVRETFNYLDKDGSGTINSSELGGFFELIGEKKSEEELKELMTIIDTDKSGQIDFNEVVQMLTGV
jgi:Ca2+-binding EF-hand superfamily protein